MDAERKRSPKPTTARRRSQRKYPEYSVEIVDTSTQPEAPEVAARLIREWLATIPEE